MKANMKRQKKYRTAIGFLLDFLYDQYQIQIFEGVTKAVKDNDINLLTFCGGLFKSPYVYATHRKYIFDLVNPAIIDDLIVISGSLSNFITQKELAAFLNQFRNLPIICIGPPVENYPTIAINNFQGMYDLTCHLIKVHNCKRIGFISGDIKTNIEALQRFQGYKQALADHHIGFQHEFIFVGDFFDTTGKIAAQYYLENWDLRLDAIISSNDLMAYDALIEFKANNIKIPEDIIVVGFDNIEQTQYINPTLTTVAQPLFEMGYNAVKKILAGLINKEKITTEEIEPNLVIRRSCGCQLPYTHNLKPPVKPVEIYAKKNEAEVLHKILKQNLVIEISNQFSGINKTKIIDNWSQRLSSGLVRELYGDNESGFYLETEKILFESSEYIQNILGWQNIFQNIFFSIQTYLFKDKYNEVLERIKSQSAELISETNYSITNKKNQTIYNKFRHIDLLSRDLVSSFSLEAFCQKIEDKLPALGIKSCYIINLLNKKIENAKVIVYFDLINKIQLKEVTFNPKEILPGGVRSRIKKYNFIIIPLYFETEKLGYILFDYVDSFEESLYEILANQIGTALKTIQLIKYEKSYSQKLEEEVLKRTAALQNSLKEKNILLMEVHHRVKNNLQIISSLLSLQSNYTKDAEFAGMLKTVKNRIKSMAIIYEKLYRSKNLVNINLKEYLTALVNSLLYSFNKEGLITMEMKVGSIFLCIDKAISCGLIINELVTNAIKHAFIFPPGESSKQKDTISISIKNHDNRYEIVVKDNGRGFNEDTNISKTKTFGLELVHLLAEGQLSGKMEMNSKEDTKIKISFNL
jgi:two-component sensor histidine kinase/DNA-binding LacI/PurR family transcriptional regulator